MPPTARVPSAPSSQPCPGPSPGLLVGNLVGDGAPAPPQEAEDGGLRLRAGLVGAERVLLSLERDDGPPVPAPGAGDAGQGPVRAPAQGPDGPRAGFLPFGGRRRGAVNVLRVPEA